MTDPDELTEIMRDVVALIRAAHRDDLAAVGDLISHVPAAHLPSVAVLCAIFAAGVCRDHAKQNPHLDYEGALRNYALKLAVASP